MNVKVVNQPFLCSIPSGWSHVKLSDIAIWGSGGTPSRTNLSYYQGEIPWIKTGELGNLFIFDSEEKITQDAINKSSAKLFPKGSVVVAMYGATIGRTSILAIDSSTNQACAVGQPIKSLTTSKFLYYLLKSHLKNLIALGKGGAQPNISQTIIKDFPILLPPLNEQTRIANKLDKLLTKLDSCKTRLDTVPAIIKQFRQSVLAAATSGKLTEDWKTKKSSWEKSTIGTIASSIRYGTSKKCNPDFGDTPVLRIPNIVSGKINTDNLKYADFKEKEHENLGLKKDDILIIRSNGSVDLVGKCALVSKKVEGYIFAGYLLRLRIEVPHISPKFVTYSLSSPKTRSVIEINARSTSGINNINSKELSSLEINIPDIEEQKEIVHRIEALFSLADQAEAKLKIAQQQVNNLTQSILAKAFRGELVPQDPNDEPAEKLLARIKKQREAEAQAKKKSPKRKTRK